MTSLPRSQLMLKLTERGVHARIPVCKTGPTAWLDANGVVGTHWMNYDSARFKTTGVSLT
jgi:hypothetical protein